MHTAPRTVLVVGAMLIAGACTSSASRTGSSTSHPPTTASSATTTATSADVTPPPGIDLAAAEAAAVASLAGVDPNGGATATAEPRGGARPRVAVFGDSTALSLGFGLTAWMAGDPSAEGAGGYQDLGCPLGRGGRLRLDTLISEVSDRFCQPFHVSWARERTVGAPDVAVVLVGPWDIADRQLAHDVPPPDPALGEEPNRDPAGPWTHIGEPAYDQWLFAEMLAAADVLAHDGAEVMWLTSPPVVPQNSPNDPRDAARMERFNELVEGVGRARPGTVHVLELAAWAATNDPQDLLRPDGIHYLDTNAQTVAAQFVGPAVVDAYLADRGFDQTAD